MTLSDALGALVVLSPIHFGFLLAWGLFFQDELAKKQLSLRSLFWLLTVIAIDLMLTMALVNAGKKLHPVADPYAVLSITVCR